MKYLYRCLLGLVVTLLAFSSCQKGSDAEETTLEVSTQTLVFAREASEQTLTVTTNKDSWSALSPQEATWLSLSQEGTTLRVRAKLNELGQERTGSIMIHAGDQQKRITVRQTAADIVLDTKAKVFFPSEGGEREVAFQSNAESVKVELEQAVDWLKVEKLTKSNFTLVAQPNTGKAARSLKVILSSGTVIREVEVMQEGQSPYIFPVMDFPMGLYDLIGYEQGRGHVLLYAKEETKTEYPHYRFLTKSKVVPFIQYQYNSPTSPGFSIATLVYTDQSLVKGNKDFDEAVAAYGFEKRTTSPDQVYTLYDNKKMPLQLLVTLFSDGAKVEFAYNPTQKKSYPTFSDLPLLRQLDFLGSRELDIMGKKMEDVRKFEQEQGSTRDEHTPELYDLFTPKTSFQGEVIRGYFYIVTPTQLDDPYINVVNSVLGYFSQIDLGLWYDEIDGRYHLTDEILNLFASKGYEYMGQTANASHAFASRAKNMAYTLRLFFYKEKPVLDIQAYYTEIDDGGGSVAEILNYSASQRKRTAFLRKLDALTRTFVSQRR